MSLEHLDSEHLEPPKRALNNLLSTTIVEQTYAQIVDGMPIASVYAEDHWFREGNPVMQHEELCPGVLEKTRSFRSQFDVLSLEFPSKHRRPEDWPEMFESQTAMAEMLKKNAGEPYDEDAWGKVARTITPTSICWGLFESEFNKELQPDERKWGRPPYFFDP